MLRRNGGATSDWWCYVGLVVLRRNGDHGRFLGMVLRLNGGATLEW